MNFITRLRQRFDSAIGFSDHSAEIYLSIVAAGLGAKIIERHFTLDRNLPGGDHAMSLEPAGFSEMTAAIRSVEKSIGSGDKKVTDFENRIRASSMRDIYAARNINQGDTIKEEDIVLMRPGRGVGIERYRNVLNRPADKDIGVNERI